MSEKSFRLFFLAAAITTSALCFSTLVSGQQRFVPGDAKSSATIRGSFAASARAASKSTVLIKVKDVGDAKPASLGTVLSADGFLLTKGTEVLGHSRILVTIPEKNAGSKEVEAKILGYYEPYDLAMLKISATNLTPVVFADTSEPTRTTTVRRGRTGGPIPVVATAPTPPEGAIAVNVGEFVITPDAAGSFGKDLDPKSYGVLSVARRTIPWSHGFLGVELAETTDGNGAMVTNIFTKSGAVKAGMEKNDIITAVDGRAVTDRLSLQNVIAAKRPGDTVGLTVKRGSKDLTLNVQLGDTILATVEDLEMDMLSGQTNIRNSGFPSVFQHDTILLPTEMGGPLVDLDGHVIGINIARAGRTETYAIPADLLMPRLLQAMKDGDWPAPKKNP